MIFSNFDMTWFCYNCDTMNLYYNVITIHSNYDGLNLAVIQHNPIQCPYSWCITIRSFLSLFLIKMWYNQPQLCRHAILARYDAIGFTPIWRDTIHKYPDMIPSKTIWIAHVTIRRSPPIMMRRNTIRFTGQKCPDAVQHERRASCTTCCVSMWVF